MLVVDVEKAAREAIVRDVNALGYPCRAARDAGQALDEHRRRPSAVLLCDWRVPQFDGLDLCVALKHHPSPPYVIVMTAEPPYVSRYNAIRWGADAFLRKPFELEDLDARLLTATRLVRAQRRLVDLKERLALALVGGETRDGKGQGHAPNTADRHRWIQ